MAIDWFLIFCIFIFIAFALIFLIYPFGKPKKIAVLLIPFLTLMIICFYLRLGHFNEWNAFLQKEKQNKRAKEILSKFKNPNEIAEKLKRTLKDDKDSAKGWYLLGKLYSSQGLWNEAQMALFKAHSFLPADDKITIHYVESVWQKGKLKPLEENIKNLLIEILKKDSMQPDCLSLLAINSYVSKDYASAIQYWKKLQTSVQKNTEEAKMLDKAILKAENLLKLNE